MRGFYYPTKDKFLYFDPNQICSVFKSNFVVFIEQSNFYFVTIKLLNIEKKKNSSNKENVLYFCDIP